MTRMTRLALACGAALLLATEVAAQSYGSDLHNAVQPASGGLAGTSIAAPQDCASALFGNPATLTQYEGVTFTLGGSFVEQTLSVRHDGSVTTPLGGGPFQAGSDAEPLLLPTGTVLQDLRSLGIPGTIGMGVTALSGSASSFREQRNSAGTSWEYVLPALNLGGAVEIGERYSLGAAATVGLGVLDPFLASTSASAHDYAVRGTIGASCDLAADTTLGAYYQTRMAFEYDSFVIRPNGTFQNVRIEQPENIGVGVASRRLFEGNLLLAVDVLYKCWEEAEFWKALYRNQWAFSAGAQLCLGRVIVRGGYAYADNPIRSDVGVNLGGAVFGAETVRYFQATEAAAIFKHRITAGVGVKGLLPNMDLDVFLGAQLREAQHFGTHTFASTTVWYTGFGLTWHFGCP